MVFWLRFVVQRCCEKSLLFKGVVTKVCLGEMTRHDLPGNQRRETSVIWYQCLRS